MASLTDDAFYLIFSHLPQETLVECRLLSKRLSPIATNFAFRHVRLQAAKNVGSFVNIAQSESLRPFVHEVTVESWEGQRRNKTPRRDFFRALAYIRFLPQLTTLNLRFHQQHGIDAIGETRDLRYLVLNVIFRCLAREWPQQPLIEDDYISLHSSDHGLLRPLPTKLTVRQNNDTEMPDLLANLQTLTISNLAGFEEPRLTKSEAFRKVMASKSLTSIKMLVAISAHETREIASQHPYIDKSTFTQSLPSTWLRPEIAKNLRVLSLFFDEYWGWDPKMDLRAVNPGIGRTSGLPNLRVLALGHYVFSHEWQVDWIASKVGHGRENGGLEELYLDTCPILWAAQTQGPLDQSKTTHKLENGDKITYTNEGYPRMGARERPRRCAYTGGLVHRPEIAEIVGQLRWSEVLEHWKVHMNNLKVFGMGRGTWDSCGPNRSLPLNNLFDDLYDLYEPLMHIPANEASETSMKALQRRKNAQRQLLRDTTHLDYDCLVAPKKSPPGPGFPPHLRVVLPAQPDKLPYILYDGLDDNDDAPWVQPGSCTPYSPSMQYLMNRRRTSVLAEADKDDLAYRQLMDTVKGRTQ